MGRSHAPSVEITAEIPEYETAEALLEQVLKNTNVESTHRESRHTHKRTNGQKEETGYIKYEMKVTPEDSYGSYDVFGKYNVDDSRLTIQYTNRQRREDAEEFDRMINFFQTEIFPVINNERMATSVRFDVGVHSY